MVVVYCFYTHTTLYAFFWGIGFISSVMEHMGLISSVVDFWKLCGELSKIFVLPIFFYLFTFCLLCRRWYLYFTRVNFLKALVLVTSRISGVCFLFPQCMIIILNLQIIMTFLLIIHSIINNKLKLDWYLLIGLGLSSLMACRFWVVATKHKNSLILDFNFCKYNFYYS